MDPLKFTTICLGSLATILFTSIWLFGTEPKAPSEIQQKSRHIAFNDSSFHIEIIIIDEVEYIVASTHQGVGICKK